MANDKITPAQAQDILNSQIQAAAEEHGGYDKVPSDVRAKHESAQKHIDDTIKGIRADVTMAKLLGRGAKPVRGVREPIARNIPEAARESGGASPFAGEGGVSSVSDQLSESLPDHLTSAGAATFIARSKKNMSKPDRKIVDGESEAERNKLTNLAKITAGSGLSTRSQKELDEAVAAGEAARASRVVETSKPATKIDVQPAKAADTGITEMSDEDFNKRQAELAAKRQAEAASSTSTSKSWEEIHAGDVAGKPSIATASERLEQADLMSRRGPRTRTSPYDPNKTGTPRQGGATAGQAARAAKGMATRSQQVTDSPDIINHAKRLSVAAGEIDPVTGETGLSGAALATSEHMAKARILHHAPRILGEDLGTEEISDNGTVSGLSGERLLERHLGKDPATRTAKLWEIHNDVMAHVRQERSSGPDAVRPQEYNAERGNLSEGDSWQHPKTGEIIPVSADHPDMPRKMNSNGEMVPHFEGSEQPVQGYVHTESGRPVPLSVHQGWHPESDRKTGQRVFKFNTAPQGFSSKAKETLLLAIKGQKTTRQLEKSNRAVKSIVNPETGETSVSSTAALPSGTLTATQRALVNNATAGHPRGSEHYNHMASEALNPEASPLSNNTGCVHCAKELDVRSRTKGQLTATALARSVSRVAAPEEGDDSTPNIISVNTAFKKGHITEEEAKDLNSSFKTYADKDKEARMEVAAFTPTGKKRSATTARVGIRTAARKVAENAGVIPQGYTGQTTPDVHTAPSPTKVDNSYFEEIPNTSKPERVNVAGTPFSGTPIRKEPSIGHVHQAVLAGHISEDEGKDLNPKYAPKKNRKGEYKPEQYAEHIAAAEAEDISQKRTGTFPGRPENTPTRGQQWLRTVPSSAVPEGAVTSFGTAVLPARNQLRKVTPEPKVEITPAATAEPQLLKHDFLGLPEFPSKVVPLSEAQGALHKSVVNNETFIAPRRQDIAGKKGPEKVSLTEGQEVMHMAHGYGKVLGSANGRTQVQYKHGVVSHEPRELNVENFDTSPEGSYK